MVLMQHVAAVVRDFGALHANHDHLADFFGRRHGTDDIVDLFVQCFFLWCCRLLGIAAAK